MAKKILRRTLLRSLVVTSALLPFAGAQADTWPSKPIRLIIPAGQGGSADPLGRLIGEELSKQLKQSVVVENRPGANGNIGAASVVKSAPDGYTMLFGWTGTLVPAVTLYKAEPYHPQRDLDPIAMVASVPNVIVVQPSLGVKNLGDLVNYAKKNPDALNFGSTGSGSSYHLSGELFKKERGVSMVHVPYTSPGAVFTDLVGGRLQLAFPGITAAAPLVKDGRLTALAVMADQRSSVMPDVPTTKELGQPELQSETWFGVLTPKGTPEEIRKRINTALNTALKSDYLQKKLIGMGLTPMGGSEQQFAQRLDEDINKWDQIVKFAGIKID